ncbi:MAG: trypco2 family protein [Hyphomicrobiales bacterium]
MARDYNKTTIADALEDLRDQLVEARERGLEKRGVLIGLSDVEVELNLVLEEKDGGSGKAGFSILGIGAEAEYNAEFTRSQGHVLRFKLHVSDEDTGRDISLSRS